MKSTIKLICFDLGGVLIRICRTWREGCNAAGLEVRGQWSNGYPESDKWNALGVQFGTGKIDGPTWARQISAAINGIYSPAEIAAIHNAWMLGEYEGVGDVIGRIHDAGVQTAALSNTNADHWGQINRFPSVQQLNHRFASHLFGLHKPDPAIYRALEEKVNRRGSEILFFDDLAENVDAARKVGWHAEQIDPHGRTDTLIAAELKNYGVL